MSNVEMPIHQPLQTSCCCDVLMTSITYHDGH